MKKLLILSGKGGTGKTTTAAAFIRFAQAQRFCRLRRGRAQPASGDPDRNDPPETTDFIGSQKARIDPAALHRLRELRATLPL